MTQLRKVSVKHLFPYLLICLMAALAAEIGIVIAAENPPPYTIRPEYRHTAGVFSSAAPKNQDDLRAIVHGALGGDPDAHTYYLVHRLTFSPRSGGLTSGGWYIYYQPWHRKSALAWLDDPLMGGNWKRGRMYGAKEFQLIPLVFWPFPDLEKATEDPILKLMAQQVAEQLVANSDFKMQPLLQASANDTDVIKDLTEFLKARNSSQALASTSRQTAFTEASARLAATSLGTSPVLFSVTEKVSLLSTWAPKGLNLSEPALQFLRTAAIWSVRETLAAYLDPARNPANAARAELRLRSGSRGIKLVPRTINVGPGTERRIAMPEDVTFDKLFPDYKVTVEVREPQPSTDFKGILGAIGSAQAAVLSIYLDPDSADYAPLFDIASVAVEPARVDALPADVTVAAIKPKGDAAGADGGPAPKKGADTSKGGSDTQADQPISSIKLLDERKYAYGFGSGIPVKSFDEVEYDSTNGVITSKKVEKQNIYAFAQFYPYPTDTAGGRLRLIPGIMAGLPLAGKPLNNQIYALNIGLWKLQFFYGLRVHRELVPASPAPAGAPSPGATEGSLKPDWGAHPTFGVSVSVSAIKSLIAGKSTSGSGSGGTGSSAGAASPSKSVTKK